MSEPPSTIRLLAYPSVKAYKCGRPSAVHGLAAHCRSVSDVQQPEQSHPSEATSEHRIGRYAPHGTPWQLTRLQARGDGAGDTGGGGSVGGGGSLSSAVAVPQQPRQSHLPGKD
eukprot:1961460-Prymnesium_polylepis.2